MKPLPSLRLHRPRAVAGLAPVKWNRFIALDGAVRPLAANWSRRARDLAGIRRT